MQHPRPIEANSVATILLLGLLSGATLAQQPSIPAQQAATPTQQTKPPTLDEILTRLQQNLDEYKARVPSFFSDEHVASSNANQSFATITDASFRLKRVLNPDDSTTLEESHEVKMINGRPAAGDKLGGSTYLRGAFSNGLALVSLSQQACMHLTLKPIKPKKPYIIEFVSVPASQRPRDCILQEDNSGRVLIDPATMQIERMEFSAPHHVTVPAYNTTPRQAASPFTRRWDVSVDYAPVLLGGKSFWLPSKIESKFSTTVMTGASYVTGSYEATYRNYHKLEVTARIVPGSDVPVK